MRVDHRSPEAVTPANILAAHGVPGGVVGIGLAELIDETGCAKGVQSFVE
jgi:hypothetical protein